MYVLGSELWESKLDGLLALVKEYMVKDDSEIKIMLKTKITML